MKLVGDRESIRVFELSGWIRRVPEEPRSAIKRLRTCCRCSGVISKQKVKASAQSSAPESVTHRRRRVAAGVAAGKSFSAIAREEGISRAWAAKQARSPEVQHIVTSLTNSELVTMHQTFIDSLNAIADSLRAERFVLVGGEPVSLGPDHYARLTGAKRFLEFASAGRIVPKASDIKPPAPITVAEVRALLAKHNTEDGPGAPPLHGVKSEPSAWSA